MVTEENFILLGACLPNIEVHNIHKEEMKGHKHEKYITRLNSFREPSLAP